MITRLKYAGHRPSGRHARTRTRVHGSYALRTRTRASVGEGGGEEGAGEVRRGNEHLRIHALRLVGMKDGCFARDTGTYSRDERIKGAII